MMVNGDIATAVSNLRPRKYLSEGLDGVQIEKVDCRSFHIVTTASLPWMTGTAVNPLLRAAYLNKLNRSAVQKLDCENKYDMMGKVTLFVPWLTRTSDRNKVYGEKYSFNSQQDQEAFIRKWLKESAGLHEEAYLSSNGIHIRFYDAYYSTFFMSILPTSDIDELIEQEDADVCILEEPEHLNSVRSSQQMSWTRKFRHVIGIMHTNYTAYSSAKLSGLITTPLIFLLNQLLARVHCHKIIKLSSTLQTYAPEKETCSNVHGIRSEFFKQGLKRRMLEERTTKDTVSIYFIGKLLWAKGLDQMIPLEHIFRRVTGQFFPIDIYGSGPEEEEIRRSFRGVNWTNETKRKAIPAQFCGRRDHASLGNEYKIFVNPSTTEVLCTTTAEALAMGKYVIIPTHPSNRFFKQFPNCLMYSSKMEFVSHLQYAIKNEPKPLSIELDMLSWDAATERLIESSKISLRDQCRRERLNSVELDAKAVESLNSKVWCVLLNYLEKQSYG